MRLQGALDLPIDERTQTCLEQIERLADSFVVRYRHSPWSLSEVLHFNITLKFLEILRHDALGEQVWIHYPYRVVYIRFIGSHRMYDAIDSQSI